MNGIIIVLWRVFHRKIFRAHCSIFALIDAAGAVFICILDSIFSYDTIDFLGALEKHFLHA